MLYMVQKLDSTVLKVFQSGVSVWRDRDCAVTVLISFIYGLVFLCNILDI